MIKSLASFSSRKEMIFGEYLNLDIQKNDKKTKKENSGGTKKKYKTLKLKHLRVRCKTT